MIRRLGLLSLSAVVLVSCEDSVLPTDADGPLLRHQRSNAGFTVNSSDDVYDGICDGSHCSLREAIIAANAKPGTDVIAFGIPGSGVHTIQPLTELPAITDPVTIDGYTQRGAERWERSKGRGLNAELRIELDGSLAGNSRGLIILAGNSTVTGLVVNRFAGYAGIEMAGTGGNVVEGNFIGTDPSGTMALGNLRGVAASRSSNNTIIRNLISGNNQTGAFLLGSEQNRIVANIIGTQVDGVSPLGNAGVGVFTTFDANNNMIGGSSADEGNTIAFNSDGVMIFSGIGNSILSNSIFLNRNPSFSFGGMGIDLDGYDQGVTPNDLGDGDTGGNERQNFPVLTLASSRRVEGSLNSTANSVFTIQFFGNDACDEPGYGEGQRYLGSEEVITDDVGNVTFSHRLSARSGSLVGAFVTATATDSEGNTSEFSRCLDLTPDGLVLTSLVGDKDGFGLGLVPGDRRPVAQGAFDNRQRPDPAFTDVLPAGQWTGPTQLEFSYSHEFVVPSDAKVTSAVFRWFTLGVQDGDNQVVGSDIDMKLFVDGLEVPGAFDDVDQFEWSGGEWVWIAEIVQITLPDELLHVLRDGQVEVRCVITQLGSSPTTDAVAIDYSELSVIVSDGSADNRRRGRHR